MKNRILIVDDEEAIISVLQKIMKINGLEADSVQSGEEALSLLKNDKYALLLLDINMHGMDGFEVIRQLRARDADIPIIVVSGRKDDYDALYGMDLGADDYITKPFNPVLLGAKVKALLRRTSQAAADAPRQITVGPFTYNTSTLRFYKNGEEISLTGKDNAMMKLFLDNVNQVFSNDMLYELVWGDQLVDENAIMVYIRRLRKKIEDDPDHPQYLQNIRGLGYRFVIR